MNYFRGRSVVVTGAGGSIGSELCRQLLRRGVRRLVLVSLTESGLYRITKQLHTVAEEARAELVPVLGSVCDHALMMTTLHEADLVIHAAAHKHLPLCETNPTVAIVNNVGGTYTLAAVAIARRVDQFILISSDKAVRPTSIMGRTKRVAELVIRHEASHPASRTRFLTVRFGNVLDTDGSVLPLWREQITRGGPVTLTDPACERYFMSVDEAVGLVLATAQMRRASGTFVLDMGAPRRLLDMAHEMIRESGKSIEIEYIGLRPGEKVTEELHFGGELKPTGQRKIFAVKEERLAFSVTSLRRMLSAARVHDRNRATQLLKALAA